MPKYIKSNFTVAKPSSWDVGSMCSIGLFPAIKLFQPQPCEDEEKQMGPLKPTKQFGDLWWQLTQPATVLPSAGKCLCVPGTCGQEGKRCSDTTPGEHSSTQRHDLPRKGLRTQHRNNLQFRRALDRRSCYNISTPQTLRTQIAHESPLFLPVYEMAKNASPPPKKKIQSWPCSLTWSTKT